MIGFLLANVVCFVLGMILSHPAIVALSLGAITGLWIGYKAMKTQKGDAKHPIW